VPRLVRDRVTWITYAQLAIWAYFLYAFNPVVPLLRDEQHTSRAVASLHGTAFAVAGIVAAAVLPRLTRLLGRHRLIWTGLVGLCASAVGFFFSHPLPLTLACAALASFAGALVVNGVVAGLSDHHGAAGPASISEANAFAAAIGVIAPLVVGASVGAGLGWRPGLLLVIGLVALLTLALGVRLPEPAPVSMVDGRRPRARKMPRRYWFALASLFATGSVEVCLTLWLGDSLRSHAHVSAGVATASVSTLLAGMTAGRFAGSRLLLRYRPTRVLLAALAVAGAGFFVFWFATVPWLAMCGLAVCGLGVAVHYPLGISLAVTNSGGQPDLAAARAAYSVGASFALAPFTLGALADHIGPHSAFLLVPVFLLASAVAVTMLDRNLTPVAAPASAGGTLGA
jgi:MFS family permease